MDKQRILWGVKVSPYVRKVQVALHEKQLPYTQEEILPTVMLKATGQDVPSDFSKASPLGKIPAFQDDGFQIADSAVICAYLEKQYPDTVNLYPSDPQQLARALWFEHYGDDTLTNIAYQKIFFEVFAKPNVLQLPADEAIVEKARNEELPPLLDYLNEQIKGQQWLLGDQYSIADISIATQFVGLKLSDYIVDSKRWPHLSEYLERVFTRKAWQEVLQG